jgi:hypothetical protein
VPAVSRPKRQRPPIAEPAGDRERLARRLATIAGDLASISERLERSGSTSRRSLSREASRYPAIATEAGEVREPAAAVVLERAPPLGAAGLHSLVDLLTPDLRVLSAAAVAQARRNALARAELAREFGLLTSAEVAELAGSRAKNRAALANRWAKEGRVFAVPHGRQFLWPGFQFDAQGQPRPAVAEVLRWFRDESSRWALALWFTSRTGWLDGRRPVDLLATEPGAVVEAARAENEPLVV